MIYFAHMPPEGFIENPVCIVKILFLFFYNESYWPEEGRMHLSKNTLFFKLQPLTVLSIKPTDLQMADQIRNAASSQP